MCLRHFRRFQRTVAQKKSPDEFAPVASEIEKAVQEKATDTVKKAEEEAAEADGEAAEEAAARKPATDEEAAEATGVKEVGLGNWAWELGFVIGM